MGLLVRIQSGPTHVRPPYSSLLNLVDLVPTAPNLVSSPQVLGKRALVLKIQTLLFQQSCRVLLSCVR
jgi:hypothetical protein